MSAPSSQPQKPGDTSPYASLRAAEDDQPRQDAPPPVPQAPGFTAELAKLQELRDAVWDAFKAGPDAGLPTILIELTNCYTNSLRVQLNLKCMNVRRQAKAPTSPSGPGVKK